MQPYYTFLSNLEEALATGRPSVRPQVNLWRPRIGNTYFDSAYLTIPRCLRSRLCCVFVSMTSRVPVGGVGVAAAAGVVYRAKGNGRGLCGCTMSSGEER